MATHHVELLAAIEDQCRMLRGGVDTKALGMYNICMRLRRLICFLFRHQWFTRSTAPVHVWYEIKVWECSCCAVAGEVVQVLTGPGEHDFVHRIYPAGKPPAEGRE